MAEGSPAAGLLSIITTRSMPGTVRVHIAGEIDLATAGQLRAALLSVVATEAAGGEVRVDLAQVGFIDAVGVGVLLRAREVAVEAGLDFTVHNPRGIVQRVIDLLGVDELLGITRA